MKTKKYKLLTLFLFFFIFTYFIAWFELYLLSNKYYNYALENYKKGKLGIALKGKSVRKDDMSGYEYQGGFQQVEEIWKSKYAWPKPRIYYKSKQKISSIIEEMDIETAMNIYNSYLKMDNAYLPEILFHVAEQYEKQQNKDKAIEIYKYILQFWNRENEEMIKKVENKLNTFYQK